MSEGSMEEETRFERCPSYGDDYAGCTCGLLQLLGFHNRIGRTIKTGSYVRLNSTDRKRNSSKKCKDHEISDGSVAKKDNKLVLFQKKEKDKGLRSSSYKRNIKAWIKKRINRKSNKTQKICVGSPRVSRTSSIQKCNSKSNYFQPNENIKEIGRTLLDGILHKIPYGQKVPEEIINGNKLFRSLSENYESYNNKDKGENDKYKRNFSSPAMVYEGKINDKKEEEKEKGNDFDELKEENNENNNENNNEGKELGMVLFEDGEVLVSEQEGFVGDLLVEMDLETEIEGKIELDLKNQIEEKSELGLETEIEEKSELDLETEIEEKSELDLESEIETEEESETDLETEIEEKSEVSLETEIEIGEKSETDLESEIDEEIEMDLSLGLKSMSFNTKEFEFVPNLLKELGLDLDTTNQVQIKLKYEKFLILNSYTNLQQFAKIWHQINKIEFSKFDCDLIPQDLILLLDLIDQVYRQTYTNPSSNIHWFLNYKSKLDSESLENVVLKEVRERVTWHLSEERESSDEADDLIGTWDFVRCDDWFDLRGEIESLVDELERFLLDDLIGDLLVEPMR